MIKTFSNVNELNKVLRNELITQSELNSEFVLNSLSVYGTELDKYIQDHYEAITLDDCMLLFELSSRSSAYDVSMDESEDDNNDITYIKGFTLKLILYGNNSSDVALKLIARLRTEETKLKLYDKGVYIEKVYDSSIINEFKNNVMWLRNDISIDIDAKFRFTNISKDYDFETTKLQIIRS